jgi:mannitol-1-phosphate 5-dehydrogenase
MAKPNILIFGAGRIGRSFIGQLFGSHGYELVFVDADQSLVEELNRKGCYTLRIKGADFEDRLVIEPVKAIDARNRNKVVKAIAGADIMAVSVGKTALLSIVPVVALGLQERERKTPGRPLDVILAENMRSAASFLREQLKQELTAEYPLDERVGLVESSIGKMVPIMTSRDLEQDPLQIFAEPYNTLILDRKGFKGEIPAIPGLALKDHMEAWVDRKAFIHNLGHATTAYAGYLKHPDSRYIHEVLEDKEVHDFARKVIKEAAAVLMAKYPGEFSSSEISDHIEDLLFRFANPKLGDTLFRVGSDLSRKLGRDDRFMGIIRMAQELDLPYGNILKALAMGFLFRAGDEQGQSFPGDAQFHRSWITDPGRVLEEVCGLDPARDQLLIQQITAQLSRLNQV